ncbi:extensin family protein [Aestuariivirga sp.]|uniref:extensin family protein n=1 Tax=Aestuariivirga sp. TaxID=2650926 RepID=UPI003BA9BD79
MITTTQAVSALLATLVGTGASLWLMTASAVAGQQVPSLKPVAEALDQMGDDFCKSFKLKCPAKPRHASPAAKKPQAKPKPQATVPAPKPVLKPGQVAPAQVIEAPHESSEAPIPKPRPELPPVHQAEAPPENPGVQPPLPALKPEVQGPPVEDFAKQPSVSTEAPPSAVTPPPVATPPTPQQRPPEGPPAVPAPAATVDAGCLSQLKNAGIGFESAQQATDKPNCHIGTPVELFSVVSAGGNIALPERPLLNCKFALQFSLWLTDAAAPGVIAKEKSRLAKVATGPGFDCRGRNGDTTAKISEHASGNAVDITSITLEDGTNIQVASASDASSASYQLLRGLRTTACGYFSTVLGPGSNAAHATHFHFDMGLHGKSANYKICE